MNFYKVLGLTQEATIEEVRSAYRRLARQHHPDITGHADAIQFREVQLAYKTLSDPESRASYDRTLSTRVPVRIVRTTKPPSYAEPLLPSYRSTGIFVRRSPFAEELFGEIFRLMDQLFSRF
jgi:DnaJ-class molecular chaperone